MLLGWKESFSVGNEQIDSQHKRLIDLFNDLFELQKRKKDNKISKQVIIELISYTEDHLDFEEELLRKIKYPDLENHIIEHDYFRKKVKELHENSLTKSIFINIKLVIFLRDWIIDHILESDSKYKLFL